MEIKPELLNGWGPGGWQFYQPETDWHAPGPLENTFDKQVDNIVAMRTANPRFGLSTDKPTVAVELADYQIARWSKTYSKNGLTKFLKGSPVQDKKKESRFTSSGKRLLAAAAGVAGIDSRSLGEWLGDGGKPVEQELAYRRATICAPCKANQQAGWRGLLTVPAVKALRAYLAQKHELNLSTPMDANLGSCTACRCVLELKVWQPMGFIKDYTDEATMEKHKKANENCWVIAEK